MIGPSVCLSVSIRANVRLSYRFRAWLLKIQLVLLKLLNLYVEKDAKKIPHFYGVTGKFSCRTLISNKSVNTEKLCFEPLTRHNTFELQLYNVILFNFISSFIKLWGLV